MFRLESHPVDNPKEAPSGLISNTLPCMETRVVIARLRRLHDLLKAEAVRLADEAIRGEGVNETRVQSGRSLGLAAAATYLDELIRELVYLETRTK